MAGARRLPGWWLTLATGLVAALPVIVATVRAIDVGWVPEGDQGIIATIAYDVFTTDTPLVGLWSSTSSIVGRPTHGLGPLLFWLLAVPARLPGFAAFPLTMAAVNTAAVVGVVALARRRGGLPFMFATAAAVAVMCGSLQTEVGHEIWNPSAALLPFTLLLFVCWSVACGEYRLLPLAVLLASFVTHCHVVFLVPSVGLVGIAVVGLIVSRTRWRPQPHGGDGPAHDPSQDRGSLRRWVLASLAVGAVCWSAPVLDQVLSWAGSSRGYGNFATQLDVAESRERLVGVTGGYRAVVRSVGLTPGWLRDPQIPLVRAFELFRQPGPLAILSGVVVVAGLLVCLLVAARRRRLDVAAACAVALVVLGALAVVTASFPNRGTQIFAYGYVGRWANPAGMFAWLALGWSAATLLLSRRRFGTRGTPAAVAAFGLGGVLVVSAVVAVGQGPESQQSLYGPVGTVLRAVEAELPHPRTVRVDGGNLQFGAPAVYVLRRQGATVDIDLGEQFGKPYYPGARRRWDHIVDIREGTAVPAGSTLVARVEVDEPERHTYTVTLRPGTVRPAR